MLVVFKRSSNTMGTNGAAPDLADLFHTCASDVQLCQTVLTFVDD